MDRIHLLGSMVDLSSCIPLVLSYARRRWISSLDRDQKEGHRSPFKCGAMLQVRTCRLPIKRQILGGLWCLAARLIKLDPCTVRFFETWPNCRDSESDEGKCEKATKEVGKKKMIEKKRKMVGNDWREKDMGREGFYVLRLRKGFICRGCSEDFFNLSY